MSKYTFEQIVNHLRTSGFVFQGSEIYGGLSNTWDYGPLGQNLKKNIKNAWWKKFIQEDINNEGIQSAILMNPEVWVATGHVANFSDPLIDCKKCKTRYRADQLIENQAKENVAVESMTNEDIVNYINDNKINCPNCGQLDWTDIRKFNLMFKTFQGVVEDSQSTIYLRPETAQGMFVNFRNVQRSMRKKLPFGIGQIGKAFRNEITPGNFIFRTREFEQMELEFFCAPGEDDSWYAYWKQFCLDWLKDLGIKEENMRFRDHTLEELAFYSKGTCDIEYKFPFGWGEVWGIANRTDYDLKQHMEHSKADLSYFDPFKNEKFVPYCVEPSVGVERLFLAFVCDAYDEENIGVEENKDIRTVMHFHPALAPVKAAVLPLSKKLSNQAFEIYKKLAESFDVQYDETGSIGKRYRRQDAIGTPLCITIDFNTEPDGTVTVRDRDTMQQEVVKIEDLEKYIAEYIKY
ncbi:MAG: glycine--tRNA ligase [Bacillota bacterium]|jgi:glycyl-tRNA synthetase|nr:glycine--tRNA ligase [Bacillota bacterium]NLL26689.1 glycine--tRNA ligase [Erysipelotrichia bacterium]